jgi:FkbH-like protein
VFRKALELTARITALGWKSRDEEHDTRYRNPDNLGRTPTLLTNALMIGSCLAEMFVERAPKSLRKVDYVFFNNWTRLPDAPPKPVAEYNFQVVQFPLRDMLRDMDYFRLHPTDLKAHEELFERSAARLRQMLQQAMRWNVETSLLTFVMNFLLPQQNPLGRLMPRHDLRNFVYFIERLNEVLSDEIAKYANTYLLDIDQIFANFGRKHFQDDALWALNHASILGDFDFERDQRRLAPPVQRPTQKYATQAGRGIQAIWSEIIGMYRVVHQIDQVKLVIVDLDDTLWRGLIVEDGSFTTDATEGWPLGLCEALLFLKKRGVLLAIASKNEQSKVEAIWDQVWLTRIMLDDFAIRKINWKSKVENVADIIAEINVLPRNVVFIDDNPTERALVETAIPGIRVLGADLYALRRILLWSSETQVSGITDESSRRTELIRANLEREQVRKLIPREEFIASLNLRVDFTEIRDVKHDKFARALELVNRTNQFNTSGRRWTTPDCVTHFNNGGVFHVFEVQDRFTKYGLVGVVAVAANTIGQFVMSCRVAGLDVEIAAIREVCDRIGKDGFQLVRALFVETDANIPCRDLFKICGFAFVDQVWERSLGR